MDYEHTGKDRSLGIADFSVTDLLTEGTDKKLKPWLSTGKKVRRESLKTDGKKTVKGVFYVLHGTAQPLTLVKTQQARSSSKSSSSPVRI